MNLSQLSRIIFLVLALTTSSLSLTAQDNLDEGKTLFKANCAQCHNKNMKDDLTGPALGGAEANWTDYSREELYGWIRNSQKSIADGQPRAVQLWADWGERGGVMNNFPTLTDANIENILAYIDGVYTGKIGGPPVDQGVAAGGSKSGASSNYLYYFLFGVLALLALVLARVVSNLNYLNRINETGEEDDDRPTLLDTLTSKSVIGFLTFGLLVLGGFVLVNNAISLGRQQGYQPEQPIKFSHVTHAGLQQIDCQYCHDGARRSKHSVIPAANTCMNCHKAVKKGSKYGTAEITKIFASIGFDPSTDKYIENYEELSNDEIGAIYKEWIEAEYKKDKGLEELDRRGVREVREQWDGIVSSLTNDVKKSVSGPIEWIRVHNLPDHVYFNHAQHVAVGKMECEACHGEVKEMEVLAQHAPLSMGWCVNCHRETEVKGFADNEYYAETYARYHEALENGDLKKVTVEDIGGLECQKCHY